MSEALERFYQATNPGNTLSVDKAEDRCYYVDFAAVRGGDAIARLKRKITVLNRDRPSCSLFTGHIGCGKSTELLRLKAELETEGFYCVYFESSEDLEMTDVDIGDVLLAIAKRISESLEASRIQLQATGLRRFLQTVVKVLTAEVTGLRIGDFGLSAQDGEISLSTSIGEVTAKVKDDANLRQRLNQFVGPHKTELLRIINEELIQPAISTLKKKGYQGLVAIVDNLDRIDDRPKPWGKPQQEYLFADQGEYLAKLACHLVYTMPLALKFSNSYGVLTQRFDRPELLPMVPTRLRDGSVYETGLKLLREMVLKRAFPNLNERAQIEAVTQLFDSQESLDRLCTVTGGHVRDLLRVLNEWITEEMRLPLSRSALETAIRDRRNDMALGISDEEWELLRQVQRTKKVSDEVGYQKLIRSRFVFEYRCEGDAWFEVNPILAEARELQP